MNKQNESQSSFTPLQDWARASYWFRIAADAWALSIIVFLRRNFGKRYVDVRGLAAMIILFVYNAFWPHYGPGPMLLFLLLYLAMLMRARIEGLRLYRRGRVVQHSRYSGLSRLHKNFPKLSEEQIKARAEPLFVAGCGLSFLIIWPPIGVYLLIGAFLMAASTNAQIAWERAQAEQAIDSMIDARRHAERVRTMSQGTLF